MNYRKALIGLLCATASAPQYCAGTTRGHITTPLGDYGFDLEWTKDNEHAPSITVTTTLPPGTPASTVTVSGKSVILPANPSEHPWPVTVEAKDPIILQVPMGWSIASAKVTTSAGTGDVIIQPAVVPSRIVIQSNGTISYADFYVAEPGYDIYFLDMPAGLWAQSMMSGFIKFDVPVGERRVDEIKFIETWRMDAVSPSGQIHTCYTPIGPGEFDFAEVQDLAHSFVIDTTSLPCAGPNGGFPSMDLPEQDWLLGSTSSVDAVSLDPSSMALFLWGDDDLAYPLPLPSSMSSSNCRLMISYLDMVPEAVQSNGTASVPMPIPSNPGLLGASLVWQIAELHPASLDVVTGTVMKVRVEP
jgi:hypothetical protein